jgi:hypothetical protein
MDTVLIRFKMPILRGTDSIVCVFFADGQTHTDDCNSNCFMKLIPKRFQNSSLM